MASTPAEARSRTWKLYTTPVGNDVVRDEIMKLSANAKAGLGERQRRFTAGTTRGGDVKSLGGGLLELRYQAQGEWARLIFCEWDGYLLALTAFTKKSNQTSASDLDRAQSRRKDWLRRHSQ